MPSSQSISPQRVWFVLIAGCLIAMIGFGVRSAFGLFLEPITLDKGWSRETFAIAMAIQNLLWGIGVPIAGALADKHGPVRVISLGAVLYAIGVYGLATAETTTMLHITCGLITGLGIAFSAFSLAMAAMAKVVKAENRALAMGLGTAAGSLGQVIFSPLSQSAITQYGWQFALFAMAGSVLLMIPLALALPGKDSNNGVTQAQEQKLTSAIHEAFNHRAFILLTTGFFVCGFHVAFIGVHFPAYVKDLGMAAQVGALSLSLIGLMNIFGSLISGWAGKRWSMKSGLSFIYAARAVVIAWLLIADKTPENIYIFAALMGVLWLSTVPLTTGIVAQVFGMRYLATLFGFVFLSHQLGSFIGIWFGGWLYDNYGSYDAMWYAGIVLGLLAALVHWFIDERPLHRLKDAL